MAKTIKSIDKSIDILKCFYDTDELGITDLVKLTGFTKSTVFDLVYTLTLNGMLEQNPDSKNYRLGIRTFELGSLYDSRNPITKIAQEHGIALAHKHNATIHLATHTEGQVVYLRKYESPSALVSYSRTGKRAPMSCTGLGKAMLAFLPDSYRDEYVTSKPLPKFTKHSITNVDELIKELEITKSRGYAIDDEEIELGLRCVAAPIIDNKGNVVGAMSISKLAPTVTKESIKELAIDIIAATKDISRSSNVSRLVNIQP